MQTERPPSLRDSQQARYEPGQFLGQRRELVDDEHQSWQSAAARAEAAQVGRPFGGQQCFAPADLAVERREDAVRELIVEVGDEADRVRQVGTLGESRTALV